MRLFQAAFLVFLAAILWIFVNPSFSQSDVTATPIAEVTDNPIDVYTALPTITITATRTPTRTPTQTPTVPETTASVEVTIELVTTATPLAIETVESTVEATSEVEVTAESTVESEPITPTPETTIEVTAEVTDIVSENTPTPESEITTPTDAVELTVEVIEIVEISMTPEPIISITPTATLGVPMVFVQGVAFYQNRQPDHSGIEIRVLDTDLSLLSVTYTGSNGVFNVAIPSNAFYWLVIDAPLHRVITLAVQPGFELSDIYLAGGDLNDDGCIDGNDIELITAALDAPEDNLYADINGDGWVDVIDIAILTGNFEGSCTVDEIEITPTAQLEATSEVTVEAVPTTLNVTFTPVLTVTPITGATATLANSPMPSEEYATNEATVEVTSEPMDASTNEN